MIKKILYAFIGLLIGAVIYVYLLTDIPTFGGENVTTQKPIIAAKEIVEKYNQHLEDMNRLNEFFEPNFDADGALLPHESGYDYVYDIYKNPLGLISEEIMTNFQMEIPRNELGHILPHKSGNPYVFNKMGRPVGLYVDKKIVYQEQEAKDEDDEKLFANNYYVTNLDLQYYESVEILKYNKDNPMWHLVEIVAPPEPEEPVLPGDDSENDEDEDDKDDYLADLSPDEDIGYDVNSGRLRIVNVRTIDLAMTLNGVLPVDSQYFNVTSAFGLRKDPFIGDQRFHVGLDIAETGISGRHVYAVLDGEVKAVSYNDNLGNFVVISHGTFNTVYGHLEAPARNLKAGDELLAGDVIGYVGNTGRSTGPHLHIEFEIGNIKVDPERFLNKVRR